MFLSKSLFIIVSILLTGQLLAACSTKQKPADSTTKKEAAAALADQEYLLTVEQEWDRNREAPPADPLKYVAVTAKKQYSIVFSAGQTAVTITHPDLEKPVLGGRVKQDGQSWSYRLKEGLFAGGELVIRFENGSTQAQLDFLGSGTPLISSERGPLTVKAAK